MKTPKVAQPGGPVAMAAVTASGAGALGGVGCEGDGELPGDGGVEHLGDGEGGGRGGEQEAGRDGSADGRRRVLDGLRSYGWWVAAGTCFRLSAGRGVRITAAGLEPADAMRLPSDFAAVLGESEGAYGG